MIKADDIQQKLQIQLERERLKCSSIQHVAQAVASTLDLNRLLRLIVTTITELMEADRSTLYVMNEAGTELWTLVLQADELQEIRLKLGQGIAGYVAETGEIVNIPDAYQDSRFNPDVDLRSGYRTRSILTVPMRNNKGTITGVVQALNKKGGPFTAEDEELLVVLAGQASMGIENSKLYQSMLRQNRQLLGTQRKLERRARELDLLLEVQNQVNAADSLEQLLDRLLARTTDLIAADASCLLLRDDQTHKLYFHAATGEKGQVIRTRSLEPGQGICGWVTQHGEPQLVNHPSEDPRHLSDLADAVGYQPRNILCVPLRGQDGVLGAIELLNKIGASGFDEEDMTLLTLVAGRIAHAIEMARAKEEQANQGRLAAIGQMLSGVVHDLKTPMTIISGFAQLMVQSDEQEVREQYAEQILKQFGVMSAMTREVLAFARGESNLLIRKVYLHRFIRDITEHLEHEFAGKGIELKVEQRYQGVAFMDEPKMRRVFHNIARNAAEAMPGGGTFEIGVDNDEGNVKFTFRDTGGGIPAELEGRMFELFATAGKKEGTGLGLALVRKIIDEHKGEIYYDTGADGTTFTITLPMRKVDAPTGDWPMVAES